MFQNVRYTLHNKLIKELSIEFNLDEEIIEKIIRSQWNLLEEIITEKDTTKNFHSLKIKYLGTFGVRNMRFFYTKFYKHLYVPREKITKDVDPRKQDTD